MCRTVLSTQLMLYEDFFLIKIILIINILVVLLLLFIIIVIIAIILLGRLFLQYHSLYLDDKIYYRAICYMHSNQISGCVCAHMCVYMCCKMSVCMCGEYFMSLSYFLVSVIIFCPVFDLKNSDCKSPIRKCESRIYAILHYSQRLLESIVLLDLC